ncbi:hypothetical protein BDN72DRAFT_864808 [Pluteus cervinus]|uniref:Uncharacterized protein n=1 Tax=Pluteus cervinus TaxID=181527 RepID=A0ACD3A2F3_9AGAR|nr:hypothetical protein BDN72DRAFT_864808 [Pluteus cervinus]
MPTESCDRGRKANERICVKWSELTPSNQRLQTHNDLVWDSLVPRTRKRLLSTQEKTGVESPAAEGSEGPNNDKPTNKKQKRGATSASPAMSKAPQSQKYKAAILNASEESDNAEEPLGRGESDHDVKMADATKAKGKGRAMRRESDSAEQDLSVDDEAGDDNDDDEMMLKEEAPFCAENKGMDEVENEFNNITKRSTLSAVKSHLASTDSEVAPPLSDDDEEGNTADGTALDAVGDLDGGLVGHKGHWRIVSLPLNIAQECGSSMSTALTQRPLKLSIRDKKHKNEVPVIQPGAVAPTVALSKKTLTLPSNRQGEGAPTSKTPKPSAPARTQWPKETRIAPPGKNRNLITIKDQPSTLGEVISLTIVLAREDLLKTNGWPLSTPPTRPFIIAAATALRDDPPALALKDETRDVRADAQSILERAENDPDYGTLVSNMIGHRQGQLRTHIKDIAVEVMPEILELAGIGRKEVAKKVELLLEDDHFAVPWDDEMSDYDETRPFCTEVILAILALVTLGTPNLTTNLLKLFPGAFVMTNPTTGETYPAIPLTLISMAAFSVEHILTKWKLGELILAKDVKITADNSATRHARFLTMLESGKESPDKFQEYMTAVYNGTMYVVNSKLT